MPDNDPVAAGQTIVYVREDAGQVIPPSPIAPGGLFLQPKREYVIGTDVTLDMATLLVAENKCEVVVPDAPPPPAPLRQVFQPVTDRSPSANSPAIGLADAKAAAGADNAPAGDGAGK